MSYTLYDRKTGSIIGTVTNIEDYNGISFISGNYSGKEFIIKNGNPVRKSKPPSAPSWHIYDYDPQLDAYKLDLAATRERALTLRRNMFTYVDKVNPIWLASMNAIQQLQVANFRQDLLDITKQPDFPVKIDWPIIPDFLK